MESSQQNKLYFIAKNLFNRSMETSLFHPPNSLVSSLEKPTSTNDIESTL